jgi:regulator of cell morphogenesis and NO signaling
MAGYPAYMAIQENQTVRDIVKENPGTIRVFEALGIDYCCGGGKLLGEACQRAAVPLPDVLQKLEAAIAVEPEDDDRKWLDSPLCELTAHIVEKHHAYTRQELPRLVALAEKVTSRHGERHSELAQIRDLLHVMNTEMTTHMFKEEQVLFPLIGALDDAATGTSTCGHAPFGSLSRPIRCMMEDHDDTGELLSKLRILSNNYQAPPDACMSYQGLYRGIQDLERDVHRHVHLENNLLFPRALEIASVSKS